MECDENCMDDGKLSISHEAHAGHNHNACNAESQAFPHHVQKYMVQNEILQEGLPLDNAVACRLCL